MLSSVSARAWKTDSVEVGGVGGGSSGAGASAGVSGTSGSTGVICGGDEASEAGAGSRMTGGSSKLEEGSGGAVSPRTQQGSTIRPAKKSPIPIGRIGRRSVGCNVIDSSHSSQKNSPASTKTVTPQLPGKFPQTQRAGRARSDASATVGGNCSAKFLLALVDGS